MSIDLQNPAQGADTGPEGPAYRLGPDHQFIIDGYDRAPAFSSFLPGIAGPEGIPLWCMYVNRGQAVVSFGVTGKDNAIAEFLPATWAYQLVGTQGFRTFCKIDGHYYEPFQDELPGSTNAPPARTMTIEAEAVSIEETAHAVGLAFGARYFAPVQKKSAALVRRLTITNVGDRPRRLEVLDGLPVILPSDMSDYMLKKMRRLAEAYSCVRLAGGHVALYAPRVRAHDSAEVLPVDGCNFYAAWLDRNGRFEPIIPLVDPDVVFGNGNSLVTPRLFISRPEIDVSGQVWENRLACALAPFSVRLAPGQSVDLYAAAGHAPDDQAAVAFAAGFRGPGDVESMEREARAITDEVTGPARTVSALPELDAYARQNYLDNVLRGGVPVVLPSRQGDTPVFIYARRHGDLERDYNDFLLPPHPLSAGPGNFRDILQNRRHHAWFYPELLDADIRMFAELLQADGYNPLVVEGYMWVFAGDPAALASVWPGEDPADREAFVEFLRQPFSPGQLLTWAEGRGGVPGDRWTWLRRVLALCDRRLAAHGHEGGYWIDHWTYLVDMLEAFEAVYPDRVRSVLCDKADIAWFDDGTLVLPRSDKTMLRPAGPLQAYATREGAPAPGPIPAVSLFAKLCALVAVKSVSLDYFGRGIEMDAGRPGWNDSLNGLPGLFGSSTCETAELARLAAWLRAALPFVPDTALPEEVAQFIADVVADLDQPAYDWNRAATLREQFRATVRAGCTGKCRFVPGAVLAKLLEGAEWRARRGVDAATDEASGLVHTYYKQVPLDTTPQVNGDGLPRIDEATGSTLLHAGAFAAEPLPLFLEGQVHWLRLHRDRDKARRMYRAVRESGLFDGELRMYKLNEPLVECSQEIGRARTFSRGWYENESIWLHMSHKYLLELLQCGLVGEFFADAKTMMVPFMDPVVYGRSIFENSSFIASSACPDPAARGRGFVARLSGTTAEFIQIWVLLTAGRRPFELRPDGLRLILSPTLPGEWFTTEAAEIDWHGHPASIPANAFGCAFLGSILLVYHNPGRRDTFGPGAVRPLRYTIDDHEVIDGPEAPAHIADLVRNRLCHRIDVQLG